MMTKELFPSHQFQREIIRQMSQRFLDPHHDMSTKSKQFVPIWDLVKDKELVKQPPFYFYVYFEGSLPPAPVEEEP
jgi:hypothetical protein